MMDGPVISIVAALIGDPARANMLTALMDGRALTASELAEIAGVAAPTASGHLQKLECAGLLVAAKQGRHRYFRLSGPDIGEVLEKLMGLAQRTGATRVRTGPRDTALREARICYDHLAGERAVAMMRGFLDAGIIADEADPVLTVRGRVFFAERGIDTEALARGRRPLCRTCLDWSERRGHLAGALGAAVLERVLAEKWARRGPGRVIAFTAPGSRAFAATFVVPG